MNKIDLISTISLLIQKLICAQINRFELMNDSRCEILVFILEEMDLFEDLTMGFGYHLLSKVDWKLRQKLLRIHILLLDNVVFYMSLDSEIDSIWNLGVLLELL